MIPRQARQSHLPWTFSYSCWPRSYIENEIKWIDDTLRRWLYVVIIFKWINLFAKDIVLSIYIVYRHADEGYTNFIQCNGFRQQALILAHLNVSAANKPIRLHSSSKMWQNILFMDGCSHHMYLSLSKPMCRQITVFSNIY